jgi:3',5'-nucleoside bisphosphate phosphatase
VTTGGGVDLHLHSDRSDGELAVTELLGLCAGHSLRLLAVTDHDVIAETAPRGPAAITGIEVTAVWCGREVHCLGYLYRPGDERLRESVAGYRDAVLAGWRDIVARAARYGCQLSWAEVEAAFGADRVPYPVRMLDLLLARAADDAPLAAARGWSHERRVAAWLAPGRPLHVEEPVPPGLTRVIGWLRQAGGVPVLAHPLAQWTPDQLGADLPVLRGAGLAGLEAWSTWHRAPGSAATLAELCRRYGMIATAGSDFHGEGVKAWVRHPGATGRDLPNADDLLQSLLTARERGLATGRSVARRRARLPWGCPALTVRADNSVGPQS